MNENAEIAKKIVDKIFDETHKVVQMNITTMSELGIAAVLSGLVGFFVAGYRNDFELSQEITPQFQKRIMPSVDRDSYNNYSYQLNDSYTKFRECAIGHQYQSENWATEMFDDFGSMLLTMLKANATQYSKNLMVEEAKRILDIATKTSIDGCQLSSSVKSEGKSSEKKKSRFPVILIGVLIVLAIFVYSYINDVHKHAYPSGMYYMNEYIDNTEEHYDCYIKVSTDDDNIGDFNIYLLHFIDDSGEYMPLDCYMASFPCGYWEWKKLLGSFSVNNAGNKYGIVQKGYNRVDCYCAEGKSVAFDSYMEQLDTSGDVLSSIIETIDFGTNNFIYQGTLYNMINEANLDEDTKLYIEVLEQMMSEIE